MYTSVSRPRAAPIIAVATPCCPAPVSAIEPGLPHPAREQSLTEGIVELVGPAVDEVLALQPDLRPAGSTREIAGKIQWSGSAPEGPRHPVEFGPERTVVTRGLPRAVQFLEGGDEGLGYVRPAVGTEPSTHGSIRNQ